MRGFINRRIGGLENIETPDIAFKPINRRIGGLEIGIRLTSSLFCINRRIGGLETMPVAFETLGMINRRIGGLERTHSCLAAHSAINRRIGGLESPTTKWGFFNFAKFFFRKNLGGTICTRRTAQASLGVGDLRTSKTHARGVRVSWVWVLPLAWTKSVHRVAYIPFVWLIVKQRPPLIGEQKYDSNVKLCKRYTTKALS